MSDQTARRQHLKYMASKLGMSVGQYAKQLLQIAKKRSPSKFPVYSNTEPALSVDSESSRRIIDKSALTTDDNSKGETNLNPLQLESLLFGDIIKTKPAPKRKKIEHCPSPSDESPKKCKTEPSSSTSQDDSIESLLYGETPLKTRPPPKRSISSFNNASRPGCSSSHQTPEPRDSDLRPTFVTPRLVFDESRITPAHQRDLLSILNDIQILRKC